MKRFMYITTLCFLSFQAQAQIGINTPNPHGSAALHINGGGNKGLLIPFMTAAERNNANNPATGLIVCDTMMLPPVFYVYEGNDKWSALSPLRTVDGNTLLLANGTSTITFGDNVAVNGTLSVTGNTALGSTTVSSLTANGTINAGSNTINAGTINATTSVNVGTTEITASKVKAAAFEGPGITPVGGIIMWSGTTVPTGWALCDGSGETPDLRGRFIVGAGQNSSPDLRETENPTYQIDDKGGINKYALEPNEMPRHNHSTTFRTKTSSGNQDQSNLGYEQGGGDTTIPSSYAGGNTSGQTVPHENRPPYYVLAFIMRVQ